MMGTMSEESNPKPPMITRRSYCASSGIGVSIRRGRLLAEAGGVHNLQFIPPLLEGTVQTSGGVSIRARLKFGERRFDVENLCVCRQAREQGTICPHVVALVYAYLNQPAIHTAKPIVKPELPPPPPFQRVGRAEASPASQLLELTVLLPLELTGSWRNGSLRIILEAKSQRWSRPPLHHGQPTTHAAPYIVSEADERLLAAIEACNGPIIVGMWLLLKAKDFRQQILRRPHRSPARDAG